MIAIENRDGLLCSYDTESREFRKFDTPEDMRTSLDDAGVTEVLYCPDARWKHAGPVGDASRESDFRHSAAGARPGPTSRWTIVPAAWVADGESIAGRAMAR